MAADKYERELLIGHQARGWATLDGVPDPGTPGTSLPYSVSTRGVMLKRHRLLLINVFEGAKALLGNNQ